jgi:nucleotide-binding universal stress UspA family protein
MDDFQRILVGVDYSPTSEDALLVAGKTARAFGGRLLVLHVVSRDACPDDVDGPALESARLDEETRRLREHVAGVLGADAPPYDVEVRCGAPYMQIVERALDGDADLIVIGARGVSRLDHALLGSVADKTVRLAPCPILTVRGADRRTGATRERAAFPPTADDRQRIVHA